MGFTIPHKSLAFLAHHFLEMEIKLNIHKLRLFSYFFSINSSKQISPDLENMQLSWQHYKAFKVARQRALYRGIRAAQKVARSM